MPSLNQGIDEHTGVIEMGLGGCIQIEHDIIGPYPVEYAN